MIVPLQLFDQVVSILDPDMCVNSMPELPTTTGDHSEEKDEEDCGELRKVHGSKQET